METPRFDNWWKSYRSGAITAAEFAEAVRGMERELAQARCSLADTNLTVEHVQGQRAGLRDTLYKLRASIGATPSGEPQYLLRPKFERWCRDIDAALA